MKIAAFLRLAPVEADAYNVWHVAEGDVIELVVAADEPAEATLSGARIPPRSVAKTADGLVTRWSLDIHTWAGRAELEIIAGGEREVALLDVAPHPNKLGVDAFREMLDELVALDRNMPWGISPGSFSAQRESGSPALIHPSVLEQELPLLLFALKQLRLAPLSWTSRSRHLAPMRAARSVDAASLRWLSRHPGPLLATRQPGAASESSETVSIDQRRTIRTIQHPATEHVRFLVERLVRVLRKNERLLKKLANAADVEDRGHASHLARRTEEAAIALEDELDGGVLALVQAKPATEGAVQAVIDHPVYARGPAERA